MININFLSGGLPVSVPRTGQSGASLLEVLIAIVIMSFGLLALGGLTASSVQYGKMAQFQTVGVQLAADLVDRMRSNSDGFIANAYNKTAVYSSATAAITVPACATTTQCTSAEMASIDLAEWRNSLRLSLPGGDAYVVRDAVTPLAVDIWVMWMDPGLASGLANGGACPVAAIAAGTTEVPRCLYFRAAI
jgi:type IV pilus assembly protein PilV